MTSQALLRILSVDSSIEKNFEKHKIQHRVPEVMSERAKNRSPL